MPDPEGSAAVSLHEQFMLGLGCPDFGLKLNREVEQLSRLSLGGRSPCAKQEPVLRERPAVALVGVPASLILRASELASRLNSSFTTPEASWLGLCLRRVGGLWVCHSDLVCLKVKSTRV